MKQVIRCGLPEYQTITFQWFLTTWCNYSCSYCSVATMMDEKFSKRDSLSTYRLALAKLKMVKTNFDVELLGGEPTLHPNIEEILLKLNQMEKCNEVEIITNLSRPLKFFENINKPELNKTKILASYHPEYFKESFIDKCVEISQMKNLEFFVNVNLLDDKESWNETLKFLESLKKNNINFGFNFLYPTPKYTPNYTKEFYDFFKPHLINREKDFFPYEFDDGTKTTLSESQIVEGNYNSFKGYKCTPLMYRIMDDGIIRNLCTNKRASVKMDNLIEQEICPKNYCDCDIMFSFYKEKNETIR